MVTVAGGFKHSVFIVILSLKIKPHIVRVLVVGPRG